MFGSIESVLYATAAFVGGHFVLSSRLIRGPVVGRIGENAFRGLYSLIVAAALAMTFRPVSVDPVNVTLAMSGWQVSRVPRSF